MKEKTKLFLFIISVMVFIVVLQQAISYKNRAEELLLDNKVVTVKGSLLSKGETLKTDYVLDKPVPTIDKLDTMNLSEIKGVRIIETVPSLDTPVCTEQTNDLNMYASAYSDVNFIVISQDTPFAQSRFCSANGIDNITVLSDYRTGDFSRDNGLLMVENKLNTRTIIVLDENDKVLYVEYAKDATQPLNLSEAIKYVD